MGKRRGDKGNKAGKTPPGDHEQTASSSATGAAVAVTPEQPQVPSIEDDIAQSLANLSFDEMRAAAIKAATEAARVKAEAAPEAARLREENRKKDLVITGMLSSAERVPSPKAHSQQTSAHVSQSVLEGFTQALVDRKRVIPTLLNYIDQVASLWPKKATTSWIAPLIILVQGSGMGKSRSMREAANHKFSFYVCLRDQAEKAYPYRSVIADMFAQTKPHKFTFECVRFLAGCIAHLTEAVNSSIKEADQSGDISRLLTMTSWIKRQITDDGGRVFWGEIEATIGKLDDQDVFSSLRQDSPTGSSPQPVNTSRTSRKGAITAVFTSLLDELKTALQQLSISRMSAFVKTTGVNKLEEIFPTQNLARRFFAALDTRSLIKLDTILSNSAMKAVFDALQHGGHARLVEDMQSFRMHGRAALLFMFDEVAALLPPAGSQQQASDTGQKTVKSQLDQLREVLGCFPYSDNHGVVSIWADTNMSITKIAPVSIPPANSLRAINANSIPDPFCGIFFWDLVPGPTTFSPAHQSIKEAFAANKELASFFNNLDLQARLWGSLRMLGRPLWRTIDSDGHDRSFSGLISIALHKICCTASDPHLVLTGSSREDAKLAYLALANARLCLNIAGSLHLTSLLTAKHMAICTNISAQRDMMTVFYPSDPILAEAAASALRGKGEYWSLFIGHLSTVMQDGYMDAGDRGELVARILLLMAMDDAAQRQNSNCGRTMPVSVRVLLESLFDDIKPKLDDYPQALSANPSKTRGSKAKGVMSAQEFDQLMGGLIFFNHFAYAVNGHFDGILQQAFVRCSAICCQVGQAAVDLVIPVYLAESDSFTAILIQVKNKKASESPSKAASITPGKANIGKDETHLPYVSLFLSLGQESTRLELCLDKSEKEQVPIFAGGLDVYKPLSKESTLKKAVKGLMDDPKYQHIQSINEQGWLCEGNKAILN
ncbi:hypothetical protein BC831DRAFT_466017 [Entophlyctis helioformis]|nr:hypothetical protein BC831DRAFT_466017 [Entophlyctis helioformis]